MAPDADGDRMADGESLFRDEALRHHLARGGRGDVLRLATAGANAGFWVVLAIFVGIVVAAWVVRVPTYAYGRISSAGADGRITAHLAPEAAGRVAAGHTAQVSRQEGWTGPFHVDVVSAHDGGAVTIEGTWHGEGSPPSFGSSPSAGVRVAVGTERVAVAFIPGARSLMGQDGG